MGGWKRFVIGENMKYPTISRLSIEDKKQYKDSQKKPSLAGFDEVMQYVLQEYYLKDVRYRNKASLQSIAYNLAPQFVNEISVFGMMYDAGLREVLECERRPVLGEIENCKHQLLQIFIESQVNKNLNIVLAALGEKKTEMTKAVLTEREESNTEEWLTDDGVDEEQFIRENSSKNDKRGLMIAILVVICIVTPIITDTMHVSAFGGLVMDIWILFGTLLGINKKDKYATGRALLVL